MANTIQPQVLLVHDEKSLSTDYKDFFLKRGWSYDHVNDLQSGVERAKSNDYDIIITDMDLPNFEDFGFLKSIQDTKPNQAVMIVSSSQSTEVALQALRSGAVDFLPKPIDYNFLYESIDRVVRCLREDEVQEKLLKAMSSHSTTYRFSSADLESTPFIPPILNLLSSVGAIDPTTRLKISLAFQEAITNSLEHGNLELESIWKDEFLEDGTDKFFAVKKERLKDPEYADRQVVITVSYDSGILTIAIKDHGKGFNAPCSITYSKNSSDTDLYGRGLTIIFGTMDKVEYEDGGTKITITKDILNGD